MKHERRGIPLEELTDSPRASPTFCANQQLVTDRKTPHKERRRKTHIAPLLCPSPSPPRLLRREPGWNRRSAAAVCRRSAPAPQCRTAVPHRGPSWNYCIERWPMAAPNNADVNGCLDSYNS